MFLGVESPTPIVAVIRQAPDQENSSLHPSDLPSRSRALHWMPGAWPWTTQAPGGSERSLKGRNRRSPSIQNLTVWQLLSQIWRR